MRVLLLTALISAVQVGLGFVHASAMEQAPRGTVEDSLVVASADDIVKRGKDSSSAAASAANRNKPSDPVSTVDLFAGASAEAKLEFFESIVWVNGRIASAKVELLRRDLGEARPHAALKALVPGSKRPSRFDPASGVLSVCGNDHCDNAACRPRSGGGRGCLPLDRHLCFSPCN